MSFESELSDRLQQAAADLEIRNGSLAGIENRASERQRRRQIATRSASALAVATLVALGGVLFINRDSSGQVVGTADSPAIEPELSGPQPNENNTAAPAETDDSSETQADAEELKTATNIFGPAQPLVVEASGVEGWERILPPTEAGGSTDSDAVTPAVSFHFTGPATVVQIGNDWYADSGSGWQSLTLPPSLRVLAVDSHDEARMVVAGVVENPEDTCGTYNAVASFEAGQWHIQRVPTDLPAGVRAIPLSVEVRSVNGVTVLSTASQLVADPLCLMRYYLASSSSAESDSSGLVSDAKESTESTESTEITQGDTGPALDPERIPNSEEDAPTEEGQPPAETDTPLGDVVLEGVSLGEVVSAQLIEGGIEVTTTAGETLVWSLEQLESLRPIREPLLRDVLGGKQFLRVSLAFSDQNEQTSFWHIHNFHTFDWGEAANFPTAPWLGIIDGKVVVSHGGNLMHTIEPATRDIEGDQAEVRETVSPQEGAESGEGDVNTSSDPDVGAEAGAESDKTTPGTDNSQHFVSVRDGVYTAVPLSAPASNPSNTPGAAFETVGTLLDAVHSDHIEVSVQVVDGVTIIFMGDGRRWTLADICGTDSAWVRLGEFGGELRLITLVDGEQRLYRLS